MYLTRGVPRCCVFHRRRCPVFGRVFDQRRCRVFDQRRWPSAGCQGAWWRTVRRLSSLWCSTAKKRSPSPSKRYPSQSNKADLPPETPNPPPFKKDSLAIPKAANLTRCPRNSDPHIPEQDGILLGTFFGIPSGRPIHFAAQPIGKNSSISFV